MVITLVSLQEESAFRHRFESCPDYTDCDVGCVSNIAKQYDSLERQQHSQVAQWLRAGGAGNVLIPNLSDTTNTSKV